MADTSAAAKRSVANVLLSWRWLALFVAATMALQCVVADRLALAPEEGQLWRAAPGSGPAVAWRASAGLMVRGAEEGVILEAVGPGIQRFARVLPVAEDAEFVALRFCLGRAIVGDSARVMLASAQGDALDFNRQYSVNSFHRGEAGECFKEALPRRRGDGAAVLQLELQPGETLVLSELSAQPLRENPLWRWIRWVMLPLGLALIARLFWDYRKATPWWWCASGILVVAGIVFGCAVSVPLKADIFALLTGGRSIELPEDPTQLLLAEFPVGGFSLFTFMHALLFACATLLLMPVRRMAWLDLALLAPVTETLQVFVPGRGPGLADAIVDWQGIAFALLLIFLFRGAQRVGALLQHQRVE